MAKNIRESEVKNRIRQEDQLQEIIEASQRMREEKEKPKDEQ